MVVFLHFCGVAHTWVSFVLMHCMLGQHAFNYKQTTEKRIWCTKTHYLHLKGTDNTHITEKQLVLFITTLMFISVVDQS